MSKCKVYMSVCVLVDGHSEDGSFLMVLRDGYSFLTLPLSSDDDFDLTAPQSRDDDHNNNRTSRRAFCMHESQAILSH